MKAGDTGKGPVNPLLQESISACGRAFAVVAVFSMCINILMLTAPLFMLQVFDRVITSRNTDTLVMLMLVAGGALLAMAALEAVRSLSLIRVSTWLDNRIGGSLLGESIAATLRTGADPSVQGLRDLATVRTFLSGPSIFPIMDAPWTPIFIAVMFMLHPLMGWLSVGGAIILFGFALANELTTRKLLMFSGGASIAALNQADAAARNADVIEAMGMMPGLIGRWRQKNAESLELQARASIRSGGITASSKFIRMCLQIGILGLGAWLVIEGELTPGAMIAGSILMGRALAPVEQAIGTWKQMIVARNAYDRIKRQLNEAPPRVPGMPLPPPEGRIDVENLVFAHPTASEPLLRKVTFNLHPGEVLGLIGPTAVGKTTLARLLVGNLVPRGGHVRLDGMDVAQWDSADLGRHIGYLPQDVELFSGTINENIARMQEVDADAVVAAARQAGVHDMILHMEKGYDTEIGGGGATLSGGQRQRIALARALYGSPRFLVLDEPNASLDSEGEVALVSAIQALKAQKATVVVIAHRPSILQDVDKILVLRNGTVELFGPREEVIARLKGGELANGSSEPVPAQPQQHRNLSPEPIPQIRKRVSPSVKTSADAVPAFNVGSVVGAMNPWSRPMRSSMKTTSNVNKVGANAGGGKESAGAKAVRLKIEIKSVVKMKSTKKPANKPPAKRKTKTPQKPKMAKKMIQKKAQRTPAKRKTKTSQKPKPAKKRAKNTKGRSKGERA